MKIYLIRHGQTNYNVLKLHNDDPAVDVHLTAIGKGQAKAVAERLQGRTIDHIFISELRRTKQTADIINRGHHAPLSVDERLNDNKSGFEGNPDTEYEKLLKNTPDKWEAKFNNGESLNDVRKRIESFMIDLRKTNFKACAIVTSRVPAQFLYGISHGLTNEELWKVPIDKGACLELELV